MAEGDKVVPSSGNSQLDPTKKNSGALNERLGITGRSLTGARAIERKLDSPSWVRNSAGMLTNVNDLEKNVAGHNVLNRHSKDSPASAKDLLLKGQDERDASRDWLNGPKKRGSSKEDEQTEEEKENEKKPIYVYPSAPRPTGGFSIPTVGKAFQGMSSLREMMEMPIANVPIIGTGKRYCGPSIVGTMNFTGAAMQTNAPESMTTGGAINTEAIQ